MVLKTNSLPAQANPTNRPAFEPMDDDTAGNQASTVNASTETPAPAVSAAAAPVSTPTQAPAPAQAALPAVITQGAVAVAPANAGASFKAEVEAMKGAVDFSFGNYPMFKASGGKVKCKDPVTSLGEWVFGRMIGWNDRVQVSPGEGKSKDLVAYSDDCVTISKVIGEAGEGWVGRSVADYVQHLRVDQNCILAKSSVYVDVALALFKCESSSVDFIGEVIQITLNPSSISSFKSYQEKLKTTAMCVAKGLPGFKLPDDPFSFYFTVEAAAKGDKAWEKLKVLAKLPTKA